MRRHALTGWVLGVLAVVGSGGVIVLASRPPAVRAVTDGSPRLGEILRRHTASPQEHAEAPVRVLAEPEAEGMPAGTGLSDQGAALVSELVDAVRGLDQRMPAAFHDLAYQPMALFVTEARADVEGVTDALLEAVDHGGDRDRIRGSLLACAGALGLVEPVRARREPAGALHRAAWLGHAWTPDGSPVDGGVVLDPLEYLELQPRGGDPVLALRLGRPPPAPVRAELFQQVVQPASDLGALLDRDLALLALGTAVDVDDDVLGFLRGLLLDTEPTFMRLRPAAAFVLSRSRRPEAREILTDFLADRSLGEHGKTHARWWLGRAPAMPGDLMALLAPLQDPSATTTDRIVAVGSLLPRLAELGAEDVVTVEEVLALQVVEEPNDSARLAAVTVLAQMDGGWMRTSALDGVLRQDASAHCRGWAAVGLSRARGNQAAEARALLLGALPREADPVVREDIERALERLP